MPSMFILRWIYWAFLKSVREGLLSGVWGGSPYKSCTKKPLPSRNDSFLYLDREHPLSPSPSPRPQRPQQLEQNCKHLFGRGSWILKGGSHEPLVPSLCKRSLKVNKPSRNNLCQAGPTESWRNGGLVWRIILYNRGWIYRETGNLVTADGKVKGCYHVDSIPHKASHLTRQFTSRNLFKLKTGLRVWQGL